MGIYNFDTGFIVTFGGKGSRSDSFKKGRKVEDKVRGTLLKWVSDDMAWVNIEGHKLLAQLNSKPQVGSILTFVIKQLSPSIVLKEVFSPSGGTSGALSLARNFETSRALFQNRFNQRKDFHDVLKKNNTGAFIEALSSDDKLLVAYLDTLNCINQINAVLDKHADGLLFYTPWIIPTARNQIGLIISTPHKMTEVRYEFELPIIGMVRSDFLYKPSAASYRLRLEHPAYSSEIKRVLNSCNVLGFKNFHCLGVGPLPRQQYGGMLAELLFKQ